MISELRQLPALGTLWETTPFQKLRTDHGDALVKAALQAALERRRTSLQAGESVDLELFSEVERKLAPSYRRVINATGTVLHTNLGRAPLGSILQTVAQELSGYSALEFDLNEGKRGRRGAAVEERLRWLTGAPAALVVNNCAAAMVLLLSAHAQGREVIVSRGELVEIGGGFRIPDILATSGARLVEVGTTNRTRISDYRQAVSDNTALFLTTHTSNFRMIGFTEAPSQDELLALSRELDIPVAYDLGSGMLTACTEDEPEVRQAARFPLCAFSGDKLLGGPQCGILLGETKLVEACRRHPLYRAFRCDKVTLALLEETLRLHSAQPAAIPTLAFLQQSNSELERRARKLAEQLSNLAASVEAVSCTGQVGGGSAPAAELGSWGIALGEVDIDRLASTLRQGHPAVLGRLEKKRLILDLKAVDPQDDEIIMQRLKERFT